MIESERRSAGYYLLLPAMLFICLLPFCFLGYGPDNDTYGVIDSGRAQWLHHILHTSRTPGYWSFETIVFVLNRMEGSALVNITTLLVSAVLLWRCVCIAERLGARFPRWTVACLAVTPVYAIASCTTADYLWSCLGLVWMLEAFAEDRFVVATVAGTLAYLIRPSNSIVIAGVIAGGMLQELIRSKSLTKRALKLFGSGVVAAAVGSLQLVLSYLSAGRTFQFMQGSMGGDAMWTPKMRVGRFGFKMMMLIGPLAWGALIAIVFAARRSRASASDGFASYTARLVPLLWGGLAGTFILFFIFPIEVSYFIPGEICAVMLMGITVLMWRRWANVALFVAILFANFVTVQLVVPNIPGQSTSASFHPALHAGEFIDATRERNRFRMCRTNNCFVHIQHPETPEQYSVWDQ